MTTRWHKWLGSFEVTFEMLTDALYDLDTIAIMAAPKDAVDPVIKRIHVRPSVHPRMLYCVAVGYALRREETRFYKSPSDFC